MNRLPQRESAIDVLSVQPLPDAVDNPAALLMVLMRTVPRYETGLALRLRGLQSCGGRNR